MPTVATPVLLTDPGFLWIAPLATADPTNTVTAGKFSDAVAAGYLALGATTEGTDFSYSTNVEPIRVAEFFDPVAYRTTERDGSVAFSLASWTLTNYRRALNGGVAALVPTGTTGSELTTFNPPSPGNEVRVKLLWESTDSTVRIAWHQCIQGGEVQTSFKKAPDLAAIPCTFHMEIPSSGQPFTMWAAGTTRV